MFSIADGSILRFYRNGPRTNDFRIWSIDEAAGSDLGRSTPMIAA